MANAQDGERRTRTLTKKGCELYEDQVSRHTAELLKAHNDLIQVLDKAASPDSLANKRIGIIKTLQNYNKLSCNFLEYLKRTSSVESVREASAHTFIRDSINSKAQACLRGIDVILNSAQRRHASASSDVCEHLSSVSRRSRSSSSIQLEHALKLKTQQTELKFAQRQADLKRAKARLIFDQSNIDIELEVAEKEKSAAVAEAEYEVVCTSDITESAADCVLNQNVLETDIDYITDKSDLICMPDTYASVMSKLYVNNSDTNKHATIHGDTNKHATIHGDTNKHATIHGDTNRHTITHDEVIIQKLSVGNQFINPLTSEVTPSYSNVSILKTLPVNSAVTTKSAPLCPQSVEPQFLGVADNKQYSVNPLMPGKCSITAVSDNQTVAGTSQRYVNLPSVYPYNLETHHGSVAANAAANQPQTYGEPCVYTPAFSQSHVNPLMSASQNVPTHAQSVTYDSTAQYSACLELSKFLIKKDLLSTRLTNFDEKPETYLSWKNSFLSVMRELSASAAEQLDLLIKYLGRDSSKWALTLKASNAHLPERALSLTWERLDERFGSPELLESAVKSKLAKFPNILPNQMKRLYDLSDVLSEIESVMDNPVYQQLFSYFNTSSGIKPIIAKLPTWLQNKWMSKVMQYKTSHNVLFPPFSLLCSFIREMSVCCNDPAFSYQTDSDRTNHYKAPSSGVQFGKQFVNTKKTGVNVRKLGCPLHLQSAHTLKDCYSFRQKSLAERKTILRENHFCFRCCDSNTHGQRNCSAALKCDICFSEVHTTAMHPECQHNPSSNRIHSQQPKQGLVDHGGEANKLSLSHGSVASKCTQVCGKGLQGRSCAKIVPVIVFPVSNPDKFMQVYAILDDQSNSTLARSTLFDTLGLPDDNLFDYTLTSCSGREHRKGRRSFDLMVQSLDGKTTFKLPPVIECDDIPNERHEIPTPEITSQFEHLKGLDIPPLYPDVEILLLIGRDLADAHIVLEQNTGAPNLPFAQRLGLGWVVVGSVCLGICHPNTNVVSAKTYVLGNGRPTLLEPCCYNLKVEEAIHNLPDIGRDVFLRTKHDDRPGFSVEDTKFLDLMDTGFHKGPSGHWIAPLPFRESRPRLPNNRDMALRRAKGLQVSLKKNALKRQHFITFMHNMLQQGHAELAPPVNEDEEVWYLPIFGVYHPKKKDKIRVVFDSSAQHRGLSLNSVLMSGPDLTNNLVGVLLRFRRESIAIIADIEQMFYCFFVDTNERNYLRFFWHRDNDTEQDLVEYRMCVHVFGNSPSPAIATYGLRKCAQAPQEIDTTDVVDYVTNNFYVDDGLASFSTEEAAISVLQKTQHVLNKEGKLRLHKVASNSKAVLKAVPVDDLANDLKNVDFLSETLPSHSSLGLCWDIDRDAFTFQIPNDGKPATRRGVLSTINSLFDPLGFLSPVTIQGKIFLRDINVDTLDWDQPLSVELQQRWEAWKISLHALISFSLPRCYVPLGISSYAKPTLHVFSDASEKAIAAVSYIQTVDQSGGVKVGFVCGKAKVAPKHGHTIPRLELCAAVLAVELSDMVTEHLDINPEDVRYYSDSQVALGYLYNEERRFFTYVANRVSRIRKSSKPKQWSYVPSGENPADEGTRSVPPEMILDSKWIKGPTFLLDQDTFESDSFYPLVDSAGDKEVKQSVVTLKTTLSKSHLGTERFKRFSSWVKLVNAVSLLRHVASSFTSAGTCKGWHSCENHKFPDCFSRAERQIILESQLDSFAEEIILLNKGEPLNGNSPIASLSPYLDEYGVLRVGGRLKHARIPATEKNPILISGHHHVATLLIRHYHCKTQHQGRHLTEGAVRSAGYWITGGKRLISSLIFKCVKCRKMRARMSHQKMADLPVDRLTPSPPFTFVGVDVFGPWDVTTRRTRGGSACSKRWGVIFTCLGCRAIHIELVEEMTTSSFINAMRRFCALRGPVSEFRSDRGTNFVGSIDELQINAINVEDSHVKSLLYSAGTVWRFNPPCSSHMGGSWERLIGVVRRILDSMLMGFKGGKLTHEVLSTFMAEVTSIVNSRPLVPISSDADSPFVLSPAALLTQKSGDLPQHLPEVDLKDMYRSQWRFVQVLANTFWARWRMEYLQSLQPRKKWKEETANLQEGTVVVLRDKEVPRHCWPLGVIEKVFPSDDGHVRKLQVRVVRDGKSCLYVRPITEVVRLVE